MGWLVYSVLLIMLRSAATITRRLSQLSKKPSLFPIVSYSSSSVPLSSPPPPSSSTAGRCHFSSFQSDNDFHSIADGTLMALQDGFDLLDEEVEGIEVRGGKERKDK